MEYKIIWIKEELMKSEERQSFLYLFKSYLVTTKYNALWEVYLWRGHKHKLNSDLGEK